MVFNISETLKDRVRRMVYAQAHAEGLANVLLDRIRANPEIGQIYAEHKAAYEESLMLEVKVLGMVGGNIDLLERLMRDVHAKDGTSPRTH